MFRWRAMSNDDLAAVAAISQAAHGVYGEPVEVYAERLTLYPEGCFVCEVDGVVRGLLVSHPWRRDAPPALGSMLGAIPADADTYYLHDIALQPATRGLGAGVAAVTLIVDLARAAGFDDVSLVAVNGADRFWAARGFDYAASDGAGGYGRGTYVMRRAIA